MLACSQYGEDMKQTVRWIGALAAVLVAFLAVTCASKAWAIDLPLAAASPLTGVAFDDRPLLLPVQRNFQMAMLTAGSELGRSCGHMEAYGWRMGQAEQGRVNQIFNNTVDRLRLLGFAITPQTLTSVSKDITLFTADRSDKHFMFLWSAGELGLVLNLCETTAPAPSFSRVRQPLAPSVQVFPVPVEDMRPRAATGLTKGKDSVGYEFSPLGDWVGGYTCAQGYTGGTLSIDSVKGDNFEGVFKFYSTDKNPLVPGGSYKIYGQYDPESKRVLINPGKWLNRPHGFYNTVIVGNFDATKDTFSAYFQGVSGCTSFEAKRETLTQAVRDVKKAPKAVKPKPSKIKAIKSKKAKSKAAAKRPFVSAAKDGSASSASSASASTVPVTEDEKAAASTGIMVATPPSVSK